MPAPPVQQHVEHRSEKQPEEGDAEHAREYRYAHRVPHFRSRAAREDERNDAHDEREGRHQDGTEPQAAGLQRGLYRVVALLLELAREFHDQNRVLAREPDQDEQTDLGEDVVVALGEPHPADREQQAQRDDQDHRQRQREALVLGGQHQEYQQDAQREDEDRRVAREDLLVGELGPLVGNAARQHFPRDFL